MAVWSLAVESRKGSQDLWGGPSLWNQQGGENVGTAPAQLTSRNQLSANNEAAKCSTFATNSARRRGCLAGDGSSSKVRVLDVQLGALAMERTSNWGGPAGYETGVTPGTVGQLCEQGQLRQAIEALGYLVHTDTHVAKPILYAVLKECVANNDLRLARRFHALAVKKGYDKADTFLCNHILRMYASHDRLQEAMDVFQMVAKPDAFTWSAIISAHVKHGQDKQALQLYHRMRMSNVKPDGHVFVAALQACARGRDLKSGQEVHAHVLASGVERDQFVCCCLVDMYAKCGSLEDAERVFDGLSQKDVVMWSAMIAGYSQLSMGDKALRLYSAMQEEGMAAPNSVTFVCLLQACASVGTRALEKGKQLHAQVRERGFHADIVVGGSLVNMYAKCGSLKDARVVFDGLGNKNEVTWTAMIAGYSQQGMGHEALRCYSAMQEEGLAAADSVTFVCLLQACANVAALHLGRQLHAEIKEKGLQADVFVASSLMNMYAKSGCMVDAQEVFDALPKRDDVTWNALIAGYTLQGESEKVFDLVQRMRQDGIQPAGITFLSLLTVCSHTGLVKTGQEYFEAMNRQYRISPTVEHYTCMVDLLGRAGQLDEALALVRAMPVLPDTAVWSTLLGACRKWGNVEVGRYAFNEAVKVDRKDDSAYVLMSNIYTSAQMWDQAQEMQAMRLRIRAWKQPGQSWWTDMYGLVHSFVVDIRKIAE